MNTATVRRVACRKRRELADQFAISARLYAEAVVMLAQARGEEFDGLIRSADATRERMEAARMAFEEHVREHGC